MKVLITGAGGLIGGYLAEYLAGHGDQVVGSDVGECASPSCCSDWYPVDLLNGDAVQRMVNTVQPEAVYHLGAQSLPPVSWEQPAMTYDVNVIGTAHLLDAIRRVDASVRVLVAGSSAEYAMAGNEASIREDHPMEPSSPYGVSKLATDWLARVYAKRYGMPISVVRPFFLVGPRKRGDVCSDFARGVVSIEQGHATELAVGNLAAVRDIMDVRDGVGAFRQVLLNAAPGDVVNICTGKGVSIQSVLDQLCELSKAQVAVRVDPARVRPIDEPVRVGDVSRLASMGWEPRYSLQQTLSDILNYWREQE